MDSSVVQGGPTRRSRLLARRHTALLVALVAAFVVRPLIGDSVIGSLVFSIAMLALLLLALYIIQVDELAGDRDTLLVEKRRRSIVGWALALPVIVERLAFLFAPSRQLFMLASICGLLFFAFVTSTEWRSVLRQREVTSETISMAISVYLLLGLTWGLFYIVLFQRQPEAFAFATSPIPSSGLVAEPQHLVPILIYFSLTTLSTIGFGDITPVTLQARYAAVAEGITGQFFLAILVARLVGMQMSQSAKPDTRNQPSETER